ncbi:MAG: acetate uptake transporter [Euryarchaeota archaeon]|nr:acetate uptake transporter [Euryarchaeota archaeon]
MEQKSILANPAPLGLMGFGMTTVLLNIHNTGAFPVSAMILGMGIFYGGLAQIIAGIMEFKKGNTFGTTAFTSYGLFWISLAALWLLPSLTFIITGSKAGATEPGFMAWYFFMWGVFTMMMFVGTLKKNCSLSFVFGSLFILFFLLALRDWGYITGDAAKLIGYEGIICGLSAIYLAMAEVLNETYGKTILPIGRALIK